MENRPITKKQEEILNYIKNEISIIKSSPRKKIVSSNKELNFTTDKNINYTNIKKLNIVYFLL